jgi:hypothetical protein
MITLCLCGSMFAVAAAGTQCSDANGCDADTEVLIQTKTRVENIEHILAAKTRPQRKSNIFAKHGDVCMPKATGCPVMCPAGEHMCTTPGATTNDPATNWCSPDPCLAAPVSCTETEVSCASETGGAPTCYPRTTGCPMECHHDQHACSMPPMTETDVAMNWCQHMDHPCPLTCGAEENHCHVCPRDCHNHCECTESCASKSAGCPPHHPCTAEEHQCHHPQTVHGDAHNWCQHKDMPCPVYCNEDTELHCHMPAPHDCHGDHCHGTDSCAPKSEGCPCPPGEHKCQDEHGEGSWCQPGPCPVYCTETETHCHTPAPADCHGDHCHGSDFCAPKSTGCPPQPACRPDQHICTSQPYSEHESAHQWCSDHTCPLTCPSDQQICHTPPPADCDWSSGNCHGTESCALKSTGCPITCEGEGMNVCSEKSPYDGSTNNWCHWGDCPVTCGDDDTRCHVESPAGSGTWVDECHPKSVGCPVTCTGTDIMCSSPVTQHSPVAHNWCQGMEHPCPVHCTDDQVHCHTPAPQPCDGTGCYGTDTCLPKSQGCPPPEPCTAGQHTCHSPPHMPGDSAHNWCQDGPCPVHCDEETQVHCHTPASNCMEGQPCYGTDFCADKTAGCPFTCPDHEKVCERHMEGHVDRWCISNHDYCPVTCGAEEVHCPFQAPPHCHGSECNGPETCAPKSTGCPVTCPANMHVCTTQPAHEGDAPHNWCSDCNCPISCDHTEVMCHPPPPAHHDDRGDDCDAKCPMDCHEQCAAACSESPHDASCTECAFTTVPHCGECWSCHVCGADKTPTGGPTCP